MSALAVPTRVMVVDDDAGYARLLIDCFSGLGFDVLYVESISLFLDLRILIMTIVAIFRKQGISTDGHATAPEFLGPTTTE